MFKSITVKVAHFFWTMSDQYLLGPFRRASKKDKRKFAELMAYEVSYIQWYCVRYAYEQEFQQEPENPEMLFMLSALMHTQKYRGKTILETFNKFVEHSLDRVKTVYEVHLNDLGLRQEPDKEVKDLLSTLETDPST